jgi:hypothetical protein
MLDTKNPLTFDFTAVGEYTLDEKTYTLYTIYEPVTKKYLGYNSLGISMVNSASGSTFTEWAIIPYTDINPDAEEQYKDSVMLYAVKRPKSNSLLASNFFSATAYYSNPTCKFNTAKEAGVLACMTLCGMDSHNSTAFSAAIIFTHSISTLNKSERTSTIYRFSFIDWRTDIEVNKYGLRIEAEKFMYQIGRYALDAYGLLEE